MEVFPRLVENSPYRFPSVLVPISYRDEVLACKTWMDFEHHIVIRRVREPGSLNLHLDVLDLACGMQPSLYFISAIARGYST